MRLNAFALRILLIKIPHHVTRLRAPLCGIQRGVLTVRTQQQNKTTMRERSERNKCKPKNKTNPTERNQQQNKQQCASEASATKTRPT
jgi:hypothetical protein